MPEQESVEYEHTYWQPITAFLMIPGGVGICICTGIFGYGTSIMTAGLWNVLMLGGLATSALGVIWLTAIIAMRLVEGYKQGKLRFSLRTLIFFSGVVAVCLGIYMRLSYLSREYQRRADEYSSEFQELAKEFAAYRTQRIQAIAAAKKQTGNEEKPEVPEDMKRTIERLKLLRPMIRTYEEAARSPWRTVESD